MSPGTRDPSLEEVRQELRHEIQASAAQVQQGLRQEIQASAAEVQQGLRQEIQASATQVRQELRQEIQASATQVQQELRQEIQASAVETRRHFDVVAEGLRSEIRLLAEGLGTLDQRVERFREEVREEFHKVDRRLLRLEAERL